MPGRLVSVHCMDLPATKQNDGFIGLRDFPGDIVRAFVAAKFFFHSRVTIWKDPATAVTRTKSIRLLHNQMEKDSSMSGQAPADYIVTFRKTGKNPEPISGKLTEYHGETQGIPDKSKSEKHQSIQIWQRVASPVWMDINPSNTLQHRSAKGNNDERHICPLQIDVVKPCLDLWTNPGDTVLTPFMGIGTEVYCALDMQRKAVGIELKESYYNCAVENIKNLTSQFVLF